MLIDPDELSDLIDEVGEPLILLTPGVKMPVNSALGIAAKQGYSEQEVKGYLAPPSAFDRFAVAGGATQTGGLKAYLLASEIELSVVMLPGSKLRAEGVEYLIQYEMSIAHRGVTMLHQLKLTKTQN